MNANPPRQLATPFQRKLGEDIVDMRLDRRQADIKSPRDFFIAEPSRDEAHHLVFSRGERRRLVGCQLRSSGTRPVGDPVQQTRGNSR